MMLWRSCFRDYISLKTSKEIQNYVESAEDKILKLERVFNYLMKEPLSRPNAAIIELVEETHQMLASNGSPHLRDILTIGCVQNINAYKIATYRSAYMFAVELELDTATDMLQQVLEWEMDANKALSALAIEEFNQTQLGQQN
jgi:ferritin-like metal-binding protein YciE